VEKLSQVEEGASGKDEHRIQKKGDRLFSQRAFLGKTLKIEHYLESY